MRVEELKQALDDMPPDALVCQVTEGFKLKELRYLIYNTEDRLRGEKVVVLEAGS